MASETRYLVFYANLRKYLEAVGQSCSHATLGGVIEEGMQEAVILMSLLIPESMFNTKHLTPDDLEAVVALKNKRYEYPIKKSYLESMIEEHDKIAQKKPHS
jgi:hypothetical protein